MAEMLKTAIEMDKIVVKRLVLQKAQLEAFIDLVSGNEDADPLS